MAANPQHANTLGNYAYFLQHVRRDLGGAAELYKAAVDLAPAHESSLVNWVNDRSDRLPLSEWLDGSLAVSRGWHR